jgi:FemAB family protein
MKLLDQHMQSQNEQISPNVPQTFFIECARRSGLVVTLRHTDTQTWDEICPQLIYQPVAYSQAMIDYQLAYFRGAGQAIHDVSLIIYHDRKPCGIWPLSIVERDRIGSNGTAVLPPLFSKVLPQRTIDSITSRCLDSINLWASANSIPIIHAMQPYLGQIDITSWQQRIMLRGARAQTRHELFVELTTDVGTIRSHIRKSYRPLISSGQKLGQIGLLAGTDEKCWQEFRDLHLQVAGRATRSNESWDRQLQAIGTRDAFLVYLRDAQNRMIGGGLFHVTKDEGLYAVAAYDRTLFDKPLGHVVQYRAIEELKNLGVKWYKIGARPYPGDEPAPSEKELRIAEFKQGFASHMFPLYELKLPVKSA